MSLKFETLIPHRLQILAPNLSPSTTNPWRSPLARRSFSGVKVNRGRGSVTGQSRVRCIAVSETESREVVKERSVSVVLLAGGKGKRMGASMPKQYLPLLGQPIALYSFFILSQISEVKEIVVVCDPSYRDVFEDASKNIHVKLKFAIPGKERQDSVFNGFQEIDGSSELVCIHDSARPLLSCEDVSKVLRDGLWYGAAVLGVPAKATIKEANSDSFVVKTLDRKTLWEMQTPQVIKPELLRRGFDLVNRDGLEVTDDVSIVEHLKHPVYITEGSYTNIKIAYSMMGGITVLGSSSPMEKNRARSWRACFLKLTNDCLDLEVSVGVIPKRLFVALKNICTIQAKKSIFMRIPSTTVTTPEDLVLAERMLSLDAEKAIPVLS